MQEGHMCCYDLVNDGMRMNKLLGIYFYDCGEEFGHGPRKEEDFL
jgi:hypothetical protein